MLRDIADTQLAKAVQNRVLEHPGKSGFYLLHDGLDAFVTLEMLASRAERGIDAQYYLLHDDLVGRLFLNMLLKAADRGVRIRLLIDDIGRNVKSFYEKIYTALAIDNEEINVKILLRGLCRFRPLYHGVYDL